MSGRNTKVAKSGRSPQRKSRSTASKKRRTSAKSVLQTFRDDVEPAQAVDLLIEDIVSHGKNPETRSVRAVPKGEGVLLYSTSDEALARVVEVLSKPFDMTTVKVRKPSDDQLQEFIEGQEFTAIPSPIKVTDGGTVDV